MGDQCCMAYPFFLAEGAKLMTEPTPVEIPSGVVAMTTFGVLRQETTNSLMELRSYSESIGLRQVSYQMVPGTLVEKARNDAVRGMLGAFAGKAGWLLFIDGDMVFAPQSLQQILTTAYQTLPFADVVGGYCTLRGEMALPTIDTGTGTWESHFPGRGPLEVIRTGAAFLLIKRHVFERLPQPWFRVRAQQRPLDALAEVDNLARCRLDGMNPFAGLPGEPWEKLLQWAANDPSANQWAPIEVGEDSGFCDKVRAAGMRIFVDTSIETRHIDTIMSGWDRHRDKLREVERQQLQAVGVDAT